MSHSINPYRCYGDKCNPAIVTTITPSGDTALYTFERPFFTQYSNVICHEFYMLIDGSITIEDNQAVVMTDTQTSVPVIDRIGNIVTSNRLMCYCNDRCCLKAMFVNDPADTENPAHIMILSRILPTSYNPII